MIKVPLISNPIYVLNEDKFIYKIEEFRQLSSIEPCFSYELDLVAGHDYIEPDYSDKQGYVSKEAFTSSVQSDDVTVFPLSETLTDRLKEEGYIIINIDNYKIHPYKTAE